MSARTPKHNFSETQRAEIFARDRALCGYSGKSLWLADHGAAPYSIDWVDHFSSVARGGTPTLENGVCASWLYNWVKREHKRAVLLFHSGYPTVDFYTYHQTLPESIGDHLRRFTLLHPSDWYLNRALFHVVAAAAQHGQRKMDGTPFKRDAAYGARASLKYLTRWREHSQEVPSLKKRGLLPQRPSPDQRLLLSVIEMESTQQVRKVIKELTPYVRAAWSAMEALAGVASQADVRLLRAVVLTDPFVPLRVKKSIRHNLALMQYPRVVDAS